MSRQADIRRSIWVAVPREISRRGSESHSIEAGENCADERFFGSQAFLNAISVLTFQLELQFLVSQAIRWMPAQMVSKSQHSRDCRMTFAANVELACANTINIAFEERWPRDRSPPRR